MEDSANTSEYRPVSRLAVAGLALGVASLLVFIAPPLALAVPAAAAVVSAAALWRLGRDAALAGRGIAKLGLMLAILALAGGAAFSLVREWQLRLAAEQLALRWTERLLAGDARTAHQMTLAARERFATDRPLAEQYAEYAAAREALAAFNRDTTVDWLRRHRHATVEGATVDWHEARRGSDWFGVSVRFHAAENSDVLRIVIERVGETPGGTWTIARFGLDAGPAAGE